MIVLLDSNILIFLAQGSGTLYALAFTALSRLAARGAALHVTPQCLIEFWAVATRPVSAPGQRPGLGLTPVEADRQVRAYLKTFTLLPDRPGVFRHWLSLSRVAGVSGRHVHDARLVAVCLSHKANALLTHTWRDFSRFAAHAPGLAILDPATV